jgi:5'-methylthioadenosine phosphorylase
VTDYDCWHPHEADVQVSDIVAVLADNAARGRALVAGLAKELVRRAAPCPSGCDRALDTAIITPPGERDPEALARLDAVAGRVLGQE